MAELRLVGSHTVVVRFAYSPAPSNAHEGLNKVGRALQDNVAKSFETATTYAGPLAPNTPAYNVRKVLQGYDIRRGHRTGRLQVALYGAKAWRVSGGGKRWTIRFDDLAIRSRVPYARWYIKSKTPQGRLVGVNPAWLPAVKPMVDAIEAGARPSEMRQSMRQGVQAPTIIRRLVEFVTGDA